MADTPATKESAVSKPSYDAKNETAQAIATLLNNEETARNDEELGTEKSEEEKVDLKKEIKDNDDPLLEDLDVSEEDWFSAPVCTLISCSITPFAFPIQYLLSFIHNF